MEGPDDLMFTPPRPMPGIVLGRESDIASTALGCRTAGSLAAAENDKDNQSLRMQRGFVSEERVVTCWWVRKTQKIDIKRVVD